ncbi:heme NO-binding domain-containing protein [Novosphingobium sp. 2638]|uniref:Heme NO-binding domain-containing protein n=2 Tax=Novosphingobium beihaiensis TaxID=2930389 RepID=A0ABT0BVE2_9SPHN|nr:heme NO-binding domain-containing protein [Novosphingobium beihaiensis]
MAFIELKLGIEGQEEVIMQASLPNDAAFTNVGNYPGSYAAALVAATAAHTGIPAHALCQAFGRFLYTRFEEKFPELMQQYGNARSLLDHIERHIHEEVRTIYPDARPPSVTTREEGADYYVTYRSHRPFAHIAFGLIEQCIASYDEDSMIAWCKGSTPSNATFVIRRHPETGGRVMRIT